MAQRQPVAALSIAARMADEGLRRGLEAVEGGALVRSQQQWGGALRMASRGGWWAAPVAAGYGQGRCRQCSESKREASLMEASKGGHVAIVQEERVSNE